MGYRAIKRGGGGKQRDANEAAVVAALRAVGASVERLSGPDMPDLLVGYCGLNYLVEVKTDTGKLSAGQAAWLRCWQGRTTFVRTPEEALMWIGSNATKK